jgi:hypothetical protein
LALIERSLRRALFLAFTGTILVSGGAAAENLKGTMRFADRKEVVLSFIIDEPQDNRGCVNLFGVVPIEDAYIQQHRNATAAIGFDGAYGRIFMPVPVLCSSCEEKASSQGSKLLSDISATWVRPWQAPHQDPAHLGCWYHYVFRNSRLYKELALDGLNIFRDGFSSIAESPSEANVSAALIKSQRLGDGDSFVEGDPGTSIGFHLSQLTVQSAPLQEGDTCAYYTNKYYCDRPNYESGGPFPKVRISYMYGILGVACLIAGEIACIGSGLIFHYWDERRHWGVPSLGLFATSVFRRYWWAASLELFAISMFFAYRLSASSAFPTAQALEVQIW